MSGRDYRSPGEPSLIRLAWTGGERRPRWVPFFDSFAAFARAFGSLRAHFFETSDGKPGRAIGRGPA